MSRQLPPFNAVKAFEAAARHGSFARAAKELSVTSTAVSQHVKGLEAWLGEPLFMRRANQVILTPAGERYLPAISKILDELSTLLPPKQKTSVRNSLSIALPALLADGWLKPSLVSFYKANPQIEIKIETFSKHLTGLEPNGFDFVITDTPDEQPDRLADPLFDDALVPVCNPSYRDLLGLQDQHNWKSMTLLKDSLSEADWTCWARERASVSRDWQDGLSYPNHWLALQAAKDGRGVLMARIGLVADLLAAGALVALSDKPLPTGQSYALIRRRGHIGPAAIQFRSWLIGKLRTR